MGAAPSDGMNRLAVTQDSAATMCKMYVSVRVMAWRSAKLSGMGLFDVFRKSKGSSDAEPAEPIPPAPTGWNARLAGYRRKKDAEKMDLCVELMNELATHFTDAKIKKNVDRQRIDLRTTIDGLPAKIELCTVFCRVNLEAKSENRIGRLELRWNMDKIPTEAPDPDDVWSDDDEHRIFVGKGVFFEGYKHDIEEYSATLAKLPQEIVDELVAEMQRQEASRLTATSDSIDLICDSNLHEVEDPIEYVLAGTRLLTRATEVFRTGARDMSTEPKVRVHGGVEVNGQAIAGYVTCGYCSSLFMLRPEPACFNCGAPYRG